VVFTPSRPSPPPPPSPCEAGRCRRQDRRAGLLLAEALAAAGVETGGVRVIMGAAVSAGAGAELLHSVASAPLREVLRDCMQPSDNLSAPARRPRALHVSHRESSRCGGLVRRSCDNARDGPCAARPGTRSVCCACWRRAAASPPPAPRSCRPWPTPAWPAPGGGVTPSRPCVFPIDAPRKHAGWCVDDLAAGG
jgi:hypothetical protein